MLKLILLYIIQVGVSPWFGLGAANLARALDRMEPPSDPPSSPRALPDAQRAPIPPDLPHAPVPAMHAAPSHSHPPSSSVFTCLCDVWGRGTGVCASSLPTAGVCGAGGLVCVLAAYLLLVCVGQGDWCVC